MALLVKQLVAKSRVLYHPAAATARFLSIKVNGASDCDRRGFNSCHDVRGLTTKTFYEAFMNRFPRAKRELSRIYSWATDPEISTAKLMRPMRVKEDAECLIVDLCMSTEGQKNTRVTVDHNTVLVKAWSESRDIMFICWFDLPDIDSTTKIYKASDIKAVLRKYGLVQLIIPKFKIQEMEYKVEVKTHDYYPEYYKR